MPSDKPLDEQPVAPADRGGEADSPQEGVNPIVVNPDQPVFPRPLGVEDKALEKMGVKHGYTVPEDTDGEAVAGVDPDTGLRRDAKVERDQDNERPATEPEGKPRDPDEEKKNKAAHKVAEDKNGPKDKK